MSTWKDILEEKSTLPEKERYVGKYSSKCDGFTTPHSLPLNRMDIVQAQEFFKKNFLFFLGGGGTYGYNYLLS